MDKNLLQPKAELGLVVNICETAKGGIATYLRLLHATTSGVARHHFILPEAQRAELAPAMEATTFTDPGRGLGRLWRLFRTTLNTVRTRQPTILFFHSTFTLPVMLALRLLRVPGSYVYCPHGWAALRYPADSWKRRIVAQAEGFMCGYSDAVVNISSFDQSYARAAGYGGDLRLIENAVPENEGVPQKAPFSRDEPDIHILFIGRFDRQKGLDILLESFRQVRLHRADLQLHIVGASVLGDGQHSAQGEAAKGITFHGWLSPAGVQGFCEGADILVVPSRWEGFGLVVPEALRAGTPVLVSDRGALPNLVIPGQTGFVGPLSVDDLTRALKALDKQQLISMRPACRASYETRFHGDRFGQEFIQLFKELTAR